MHECSAPSSTAILALLIIGGGGGVGHRRLVDCRKLLAMAEAAEGADG